MKGRAEQLIILLKLLDILHQLPLVLPSRTVQSPLTFLDMLIQHRMSSEYGVDVIPQLDCICTVFFGLLEEFKCNLAIELGLVDVGLDYLIECIVYLVLVQARGLLVAYSRELVSDLPVV